MSKPTAHDLMALEAKLRQRDLVIEEQRKTIAALRESLSADPSQRNALVGANVVQLTEELCSRGYDVAVKKPARPRRPSPEVQRRAFVAELNDFASELMSEDAS